MPRAVARARHVLARTCALSVVVACVSPQSAHAQCGPHASRYPVAGPVNGGYDLSLTGTGSASYNCDGRYNNSDYLASGPSAHHGNDFFASFRAPIIAVTDGVVAKAEYHSSLGYRVAIHDRCGWEYDAGHLDSIAPGIHLGVVVRAGDLIGFMGASGPGSHGAVHLHFNVHHSARAWSEDVDPFGVVGYLAPTSCLPVGPICARAPEVCDGRDNDCDGVVDDALSRPCGSDVGECRRGAQTCHAGSWGACAGAVSPATETCDARDNDCDGVVDDALSRPCGSDVGECRRGAQTCRAGSWGACAGAVSPATETCDARDNDCDGVVDDSLSRLCGSDVGECRRGAQTCRAGSWGACAGAVSPATETCDARDNDCDGVVDDALSRRCGSDVGECVRGVQTCAAGGWGLCGGAIAPVPERCDALDNDCDGARDDEQVCEIDDVVAQSATYGGGAESTDVDGDGVADVCARTSLGLECHAGSSHGFTRRLDGPTLTGAGGWSMPSQFSTLRMADLDHDGRADLCARASTRVECWLSGRAVLDQTVAVGPRLSAEEWGDPSVFTTLRLADVDANGLLDVCLRTGDGFGCWIATDKAFVAGPLLTELSDAAGLDDVSRYGTLRMGDVDGDGRSDVCARRADGMQCWLATPRGGFDDRILGPLWGDAAGWGAFERWSTIRLADVDGDGRADLCARERAGFVCHLSNGRGFDVIGLGPALADEDGWSTHAELATLRLGDLDGDGDLDLCGRAHERVRCWLWDRGFSREIAGPALPDADGWSERSHYLTLRLADVDADDRADLCARGSEGVTCWRSDGGSFSTVWLGPRWSDDSGADALDRYATLRIASLRPRARGTGAERAGEPDGGIAGALTGGAGCAVALPAARRAPLASLLFAIGLAAARRSRRWRRGVR